MVPMPRPPPPIGKPKPPPPPPSAAAILDVAALRQIIQAHRFAPRRDPAALPAIVLTQSTTAQAGAHRRASSDDIGARQILPSAVSVSVKPFLP